MRRGYPQRGWGCGSVSRELTSHLGSPGFDLQHCIELDTVAVAHTHSGGRGRRARSLGSSLAMQFKVNLGYSRLCLKIRSGIVPNSFNLGKWETEAGESL